MAINNISLCDDCGVTVNEDDSCPKCGGELSKIGWVENGK